jgi:hypothetical protein
MATGIRTITQVRQQVSFIFPLRKTRLIDLGPSVAPCHDARAPTYMHPCVIHPPTYTRASYT